MGIIIYKSFRHNLAFQKDYERILDLFGFDERNDARSRDVLVNILPAKTVETLIGDFGQRIQGKVVAVVGSGPNAPSEIKILLQIIMSSGSEKVKFIAADGAARLLLENGVLPTGVFTDLDGITPDIMRSLGQQECVFVIHAHGDNVPKLEAFQQAISELNAVIGTTQTHPKDAVINPGGFTDGDRILYFLSHFPQALNFKVLLVGMDFGPIVGRYSKPEWVMDRPATPFKAKKLQVAVELIKNLLLRFPHPIFEMEQDYPFPGVQKLSPRQIATYLLKTKGLRDQ